MYHLLLSGGGADGIAYVGVIQALEEANLYHEIRHTAGTSIGAFFAFIVACQIPSVQLKPFIYDLCKHIETLQWQTNSVLNLITRMTIDSGQLLNTMIERVFVLAKIPLDTTFVQFSKMTGRTCGCCAVCVEQATPTYFTIDTTPDVKIFDALYASMAIPIIFPPKVMNGLHYIDGGFIDNFPIDIFLKQPYHKDQVNIQDIYGLYIYKTFEKSENPYTNLLSLGSALIRCIFTKSLFFVERYIKLLPNFMLLNDLPFNIIPYQANPQGFRLIFPEEKIKTCIELGYQTMKKKIESSQTLT